MIQTCDGCGMNIPGSLPMMDNHHLNECKGRWINEDTTLPNSIEEERNIIQTILITDKMERGNTYYVISFKWFQLWKEYVDWIDSGQQSQLNISGKSSRKPTPIDNSYLLKNNDDLKDLQQGYDYDIVPRRVWMRWIAWYGGGPEIPRTVTFYSLLGINLFVNLYPIVVKVVVSTLQNAIYCIRDELNNYISVTYSFHIQQPIIDIKYLITNDLNIRPHSFTMYIRNERYERLKIQKEHHRMTINQLGIKSNNTTIILIKETEIEFELAPIPRIVWNVFQETG